MLSRRSILWLAGAAGLSTASVSAQRGRGADVPAGPLPPSIAGLSSMRSLAKPITADERRARLFAPPRNRQRLGCSAGQQGAEAGADGSPDGNAASEEGAAIDETVACDGGRCIKRVF